jgi:hypothetical protein
LSQKYKAKLPYDRLDLLLVDEMGKDISGSGLDTKVIGRIMNIYEKELQWPKITRLVTLAMSEKGGGNAIGLGLSDFITKELYEKVDPEMTNLNSVVAVSPEKGRCPIVCPQALSAVQNALATIGPYSPQTLEMAWISNTKDLEYLAVSEKLWNRAEKDGLEPIGALKVLPFFPDGKLPKLCQWIKTSMEKK